MAKQLQLRRGTTAEIAAFTGAVGEPTYDTQTKTLQIHDGATAGGFSVSQIRVVSGVPGAAQTAGELLHIDKDTGGVWFWDGSQFVGLIAPA